MTLPSLADAILVIVLLIPGFISLMLFRRIAVLQKKISERELVIWSIFISLLIYLIFSLITGISGIDNLRDSVLLPENLKLIIVISLVFGIFPGILVKIFFRRNITIGDCWDIVFKNASKDKKVSWILVHTNDGCEYLGKLHYSGEGEAPREITIRSPKLIIRRKNGDELRRKNVGKEIFFNAGDIKRVVFYDEV